MQSIFLFGVYCSFFIVAVQAPFVLALGYVWIDLFKPQIVNPGIMGMFPLAVIMGGGAMLGYLVGDRKESPGISATLILLGVFAIWMMINTNLIAVFPYDAAIKNDTSFKTVIFAMFIPFIFRSRIQIEAMILIILGSAAGNAMAYAAKVIVGGGSSYGQALGLARSDSGFGESSTFSMVCAALVPLVLWSMRHAVIIPQFPMRRAAHIIGCFGLVLALLGTHARTGLVALAALAVLLWLQFRHKVLTAAMGVAMVIIALPFFGEKWVERMDTIVDPTSEGSAMGRILVWKWTWAYVLEHPLGCGFECYKLSSYRSVLADGREQSIAGKAFHSIYFESLGELGFPGFFILMSLFAVTFVLLYRLRWQTRNDPDLAWMTDLSKALISSLIVYMIGGAFVGIAFQPLHYYWMTLAVSLTAYYARYRREVYNEAAAHQWTRQPRPGERRVLPGAAPPWRAGQA